MTKYFRYIPNRDYWPGVIKITNYGNNEIVTILSYNMLIHPDDKRANRLGPHNDWNWGDSRRNIDEIMIEIKEEDVESIIFADSL